MIGSYHHGSLRQALLDAAGTLLERDGIQALTLRAAARAAGVSHAAPGYHFTDLTGLLTELAALGFTRFHDRMAAELDAAPVGETADPRARTTSLGRGYVAFARASPGMFLLMFRSERLDWTRASLRDAGDQAFALLANTGTNATLPPGLPRLAAVTAQWALVHGLAMLLIDGRLGQVTQADPSLDIDTLIEAVLANQSPSQADAA